MTGGAKNGNFKILPSWIPIEAYVMGGRQDSSFFNNMILAGDYNNNITQKDFPKNFKEFLKQK